MRKQQKKEPYLLQVANRELMLGEAVITYKVVL